MVKNDALFSYIAPTNIFAWLLLPLRYCMPLRQFVWLNRSVIKITHFPLLSCIYLYERFWLATAIYDPTDLVKQPAIGRPRALSLVDPASRSALFSPNVRVREESVVGFQKDRALEEVFRRAPENLKMQRQKERRKTQAAVRNWMDQADEGLTPRNWPTIDGPLGVEIRHNSSASRDPRTRRFRQLSDVRSTASDPADLMSTADIPASRLRVPGQDLHDAPYKDQTDGDGDDELVTNDEDEEDITTNTPEIPPHASQPYKKSSIENHSDTPVASRLNIAASGFASTGSSGGNAAPTPRAGPSTRRALYSRAMSTSTILYKPSDGPRGIDRSTDESEWPSKNSSRPLSRRNAGMDIPTGGRGSYMAAKPRPINPSQDMTRTVPQHPIMPPIDSQNIPRHVPPRRLSSLDMEVYSEMGLEDPHNPFGGVPSSFVTQMAMATGLIKDARTGKDSDRMSRLVLAKMKTLEESFADVVREMRVMRSTAPTTHNSGNDSSASGGAAALVDAPGRDYPKSPCRQRKGKQPGIQLCHNEQELWMTPRAPGGKGKGKEKEDDTPPKGTTPGAEEVMKGSSTS